jgi:hypothetical protein
MSISLSGSLLLTGSIVASGNLTTTGTITAQTLVVQTITSSIVNITGSNIFGSRLSDTQTFTGSVVMTGSLTVNTTGTELQVNNNGVVLGNALTDNHSITGSLRITGSVNGIGATFSGNTNNGSGAVYPRLQVENLLATQGDGSSTFNFADVRIASGNSAVQMFLATSFAAGTWEPQGLISVASNHPLVIRTNNTERMRINAAGTASFTSNTLSNSADAATINLKQNSTTANTGIYLERSGEQKGYYIYMGGSVDSLTFQRNNAGTKGDVMSLTRDGNVGIGTSSPQSKLDVVGTTSLSTVSGRSYNTGIVSSQNPNFVNGSGFLSIPVKVGDVITFFSGQVRTVTAVTDTQLTLNANWTISFAGVNATGVGGIGFDTGGSQRMLIDTGGTVYINTTSNPTPGNAAPQFGVVGAAGTDAINIKHDQNANNTVNIWQIGTTSHNAIAFYKGDTQTNRGLITVTTSGTTYNSVSDYRLKENITPLENGLDRILQLKPSKFNWIETGEETEGFIAHELQEYFPDAVTGEKDAVYSSTGNMKPQSVDYGRITPLLVKAIQEQQAQIEELTQKVTALENK